MSTGNLDAVRVPKRKAKSLAVPVSKVQLEDTRIEWVKASDSILAPTPRMLCVTLGYRLRSQGQWSNNWRAAYGRSQQLRKAVMHALARVDIETVVRFLGGAPNVIRFVRLAPRALDDDNLVLAMKPARDQTCCWLQGENSPTARANDGARSGYRFDYGRQKQTAYGIRLELWRET